MVDKSIFPVFLKNQNVAIWHHLAIIVIQSLKTAGRSAKVAVCSRLRAIGLGLPRLILELGRFCLTGRNAEGGGSINVCGKRASKLQPEIRPYFYSTKLQFIPRDTHETTFKKPTPKQGEQTRFSTA
jgi:hypothetical protein